jgi:hypothetical protein
MCHGHCHRSVQGVAAANGQAAAEAFGLATNGCAEAVAAASAFQTNFVTAAGQASAGTCVTNGFGGSRLSQLQQLDVIEMVSYVL